MNTIEKRLKLFEEFYHVLDQWLSLYEAGKSVVSTLEEQGYYKIAIYGMGAMAMHLIQALCKSKVSVEYVVDKNPTYYYTKIKIMSIDDNLMPIDAIIYTNPNEDLNTLQELEKKMNCPIISLADVVFDNL